LLQSDRKKPLLFSLLTMEWDCKEMMLLGMDPIHINKLSHATETLTERLGCAFTHEV